MSTVRQSYTTMEYTRDSYNPLRLDATRPQQAQKKVSPVHGGNSCLSANMCLVRA